MGLEIFEKQLLEMYEIYDFHHACAILSSDFQEQLEEIVDVLKDFRLLREDIVTRGGRKSPIANRIDSAFSDLGWEEKGYETSVTINGIEEKTPTHKFDCVKGRVALEIQWNNKDPFFDRDLRNFRNLFEKGAISVGVLITRSSELQEIFKILDKGDSYGASTTHMNKLMDRIDNRGAGGCPLLVIGISPLAYRTSADEEEIALVDNYNSNLINWILTEDECEFHGMNAITRSLMAKGGLSMGRPYGSKVRDINEDFIRRKFINRHLSKEERISLYENS